MKTAEEHTRSFWVDPENAIQVLIREVANHYHSRRELSRVVEARTKLLYPDNPIANISVTFWISWAFGIKGKSARVPTLRNGVRLFRILLELKHANDKKNELLAVPTP